MKDNNRFATELVIMAAGVGVRFGQGIKQLTQFGKNGEIIMDYSIYDAIRAGFDRIIFVIRRDLEKEFRDVIGRRIESRIDVAYAYQDKYNLPEHFELPQGRIKPWGTGHAILSCKGIVNSPFCVINADDYYGREAFSLIHDYLVNHKYEDSNILLKCRGTAARSPSSVPLNCIDLCMAGFILKNTLSDNGGVTRGVCKVGVSGELMSVAETKNIVCSNGKITATNADGATIVLDGESLVSMNMWGFGTEFIDVLEAGFHEFLVEHIGTNDENTAEYLLPDIVDTLLCKRRANVTVLPTDDKWFGITFHEDIPSVRDGLHALTVEGVYPYPLWN